MTNLNNSFKQMILLLLWFGELVIYVKMFCFTLFRINKTFFQDGSQISTSSFDISELRQSILSDTELTQPQQLTSGKENVLFHFVQFDSTEGVIVRPPECCIQSHTMEVVLHNFRQASLKIHSIFENTMRFKVSK